MKKYPILILHGWNLTAAKYDTLKIELEKRGFKVIYVNLPGFRNTVSLRTPYTIGDYGKYVADYLKRHQIQEVAVIGHSFGGRVGIYLSLNFPRMIRTLILSGTPGLGADLTLKEKVYLFLAKSGKIVFSIPFLSMLQGKAQKILYKFVGSYDYYKTRGVLRETFKNIIAYRLEPFLDKIRQPTLIIWGEDDNIVPVRVAFGMNKLIKHSELVIISGARHGVPWTHPKEFADKVHEFVKNL